MERVPIEAVHQRWGGTSRTGGCSRGAYRPQAGVTLTAWGSGVCAFVSLVALFFFTLFILHGGGSFHFFVLLKRVLLDFVECITEETWLDSSCVLEAILKHGCSEECGMFCFVFLLKHAHDIKQGMFIRS